MRLRRTAAAERDLLEIWDYIARDNVAAADRMLERFQSRFTLLLKFPEMGESQEQYRAKLRVIVEGNYLIFYEPGTDEVLIYRVLHGARRWEDLLADKDG